MRWRSLPAVLVFAVLASPLVPDAQQPWKTYRIGLLSPGSASLTPREAMTTGARRGWALLLVALAGCASPATTPDAAPRTEEIAPRFVASGPDAEVYGAARAIRSATARRTTTIPVLVGSHSHLDEIFEGRRIRKAPTPSRLGRVPAEPTIAWTVPGARADARRLPGAQPVDGADRSHATTRSWSSATSTDARTAIASRRGPWRRR